MFTDAERMFTDGECMFIDAERTFTDGECKIYGASLPFDAGCYDKPWGETNFW